MTHEPQADGRQDDDQQPDPPPGPVRRSGSEVPWAAQGAGPVDRSTGRHRHVVEGLPDWEPLPPGETLVRRPGTPR
ncbi:hypothetical protein ACIBG6_16525 [Streptomyces sp. NPDC050842]|uniref:hypothetical protein n=1 Tax=Streptomyces sp. NPDC050842 TaxID=3365636 RepID=UPI0037B3E0E8